MALQIPNEWATVQGQQTLRSRHQPHSPTIVFPTRVQTRLVHSWPRCEASRLPHTQARSVTFFRLLCPRPSHRSPVWVSVRRSPMRGTLVGDCSVVASAPLRPVAPTMDARFGTPFPMPIPSVAHMSSTSTVEEAAVGPSSSPESSTPLRQVGVTLISFLTRSLASGAESTIVHITQGRHATSSTWSNAVLPRTDGD